MGARVSSSLAVSVLVVCALPHAVGAAPTPSPAPGAKPTPRCHVVADHPTPHPSHIRSQPSPYPTTPDYSGVTVVIPRVVCSGLKPSIPPGKPVQGTAGGASTGSHGGKVPFTGAELALMLVLGLGLLVTGLFAAAAGRRRRTPAA